MSKLIGTNPNQVPSNADLGSAAFMDAKEFLLSKGSSISAIDAIITRGAGESVIDVFIYDTNKDSDGGAWRKRTQHTSWYNEKLNTTERGSRREFPSVAVIVLSDYAITIYDADDPTLPMWMTFWRYANGASSGTTTHWNGGGGVLRSIYALNGHMVLGGHSGGRGFFLIKDKMIVYYTPTGGLYKPGGGLIRRNEPYVAWVEVDSDYKQIVNQTINDVAMAVLPSAPIDADTGLPTPTIALATAGGVSILKDDGNVSNITWSNGSHSYLVTFIDNKVFVSHDFSGAVARHGHLFEIPYGNLTEGAYYSKGSAVEFYGPSGFKLAPSQESYVNITKQAGPAFGFSGYLAKYSGLAILKRNTSSYTKSAVANITTSYNSGYMVGDIKLATLSDTDGTNVTGSNLFTNGDFSNGSTGWGTSGVWSVVGGQITTTNASLNFSQNPGIISGRQYLVKYEITAISGTFRVELPTTQMGAYRSSTGVYEEIITADGTGNVYFYGSGSVTVDNVEIHLLEQDRSVNGKGLQVFGSVDKTPVATGADLVGYSGFSSSNYLQQPPNTDLHFSMSDDFCLTGWFKESANSGYPEIIKLWDGAQNAKTVIQVFTYGTSKNIYFNIIDSDASQTSKQIAATSAYVLDTWTQVTAILRNGVMELWVNGVLKNSMSDTASLGAITNSSTRLKIGSAGNSTIALVRISKTAPTAEQVKKMYNDEKFLFQENAKATLYGTSDTPTALAYDDDTELLHAGTSAGRSVFQGLRRIDNTTDAVGAAISASNGMVAED